MSIRLFRVLPTALALLACLATLPAFAVDVIVNGQRLNQQAIRALESAYGTALVSGRYWYDSVSGLWGYEGGPHRGQIAPNLPLGGRLRANASNGNTKVFVNGRELHYSEVRQLQQRFGYVNPGRYWLNANGIGGYEGGPAQFDLNAGGGGRSRGHYGANQGGYVGSDGKCSYVYIPDSGYVMNGC